MSDYLKKDDPFWINPCGLENDQCIKIPEEERNKKLHDVLKTMKDSSMKALIDAKKLKDYLKSKYQSINVETLQPSEDFNFLKHPTMKFDSSSDISSMPVAFNILQRFAVALEKMTEDAQSDLQYGEKLKDIIRSLKDLLCSVYMLIIFLHQKHLKDITRDVLPEILKENIPSVIAVRDITISKKYVDVIDILYSMSIGKPPEDEPWPLPREGRLTNCRTPFTELASSKQL